MPTKKAQALSVTLVADRVTKGAVRFMQEGESDWPLNVYLRKEQCEQIAVPAEVGATVQVTIEGR